MNFEKKIEEAAEKKFPIADESLSKIRNIFIKKVRKFWIDGALSPEAKEYHTKGLFTEEDMIKFADYSANMLIRTEKALSLWLEQNKK